MRFLFCSVWKKENLIKYNSSNGKKEFTKFIFTNTIVFFYIIADGDNLYLLHACRKQKNRTEKKDKNIVIKRAKELDLDAIHDTVHEMARDEARHGKAFEGLLKRYFG